jgi:hypothetical protein
MPGGLIFRCARGLQFTTFRIPDGKANESAHDCSGAGAKSASNIGTDHHPY